MGLEAILGGASTAADSMMGNIVGLANTFNRLLIGKGFEQATMPAVQQFNDRANDVGNWMQGRAGDAFNERRDAFNRNIAAVGSAQRGEGPMASIFRQNGQQDLAKFDEAVNYADSVVQPQLDNAQVAFNKATGQYEDTRRMMRDASTAAVSSAQTGLDRTLQEGGDVLSNIKDQVATGLKDISSSMESVNQDVEQQAQQLELAGQHGQAEALRARGRFTVSKQIGDQSGKLRVAQSQLETQARQTNMALNQQAQSALTSAILSSAGAEAGANAQSVQNLISAAAQGNQAAALAIQGPMGARIQRALAGERYTSNLAQATGQDVQLAQGLAFGVDAAMASQEHDYQQGVLGGLQTQLTALNSLVQGHLAVAGLLSAVQLSYNPTLGPAMNDYFSLSEAGRQPDSGGADIGGFATGTLMSAPLWANAFGG